MTTTEADVGRASLAVVADPVVGDQAPTPLSSAGRRRLRDALLQLAQGITALHDAGKLHRDIKPSNVLVTPGGRVVLLDFGLATELGRQGLTLTSEVHALGTAAYMSPEQAAGTKVSAASDWYSMGVMLYEALTGRLPFLGSALEVMMDKQRFDPPPPGELVPGLPDDLAALCVDLLRRDPSARPTGHEILRRLGGGAGPDHGAGLPSSVGQITLVGRARHRDALRDAFAAVTAGRTVILRVHGPSGAGKSILVQRYLDELIEGEKAVVLAGRCYQQESVPYKALDAAVDMLARYLTSLPPAEVRALLPRDVAALARVFPALLRVEAIAEAPRRAAEVPDPQESRRRAFAALRELLARLGDRRPLVVSIDDAQWGDLDSATLLAEILRPPDPPVLLLVASYRSEDRETSPFVLALGEPDGRPDPVVERRELLVEALTPAESRELAMTLIGNAGPAAVALAEDVARESGGNPFFVGELVRHVQAGEDLLGGPGTAAEVDLDDVVWARIRRLPEEARRLLEVVAISGRPLRQTDACRCVEGLVDGRSALALLRSGRLVRGVAGSEEEIETYHDRVRETVVARLGPEALRRPPPPVGAGARGVGPGRSRSCSAPTAAARERQRRRGATSPRRPSGPLMPSPSTGRRSCTDSHWRCLRSTRVRSGGCAWRWATPWPTRAAAPRPRGPTSRPPRARPSPRRWNCAAGPRCNTSSAGISTRASRPSAPCSARWACGCRLRLTGRSCHSCGGAHCLRLRGLGYRRRDPREISAAELTRIDVCWSAATGLSVVDTIRGADFQSRCLLLALGAGERSRIARSLAMEAAHSATDGLRRHSRTARLLAAADELARQVDDPYPLGMVALAHGAAFYLECDWKEAHTHCDRACDIFRERCTGVHWERNTATAFGLWALSHMGEIRRARSPVAPTPGRGSRPGRPLRRDESEHLPALDRPPGGRRARPRARRGRPGHGPLVAGRLSHSAQRPGLGDGPDRALRRSRRGGVGPDRVELAGAVAFAPPASSVRSRRHVAASGPLRLAAAECSSEPEPLLHAAAADARRLEREATPWSQASARLVRAALAWNRGDDVERSRSPDRRRRAVRRHSHGSLRGRGPAAAWHAGRRRPGRDARRAGRRLDARSGDPRAGPHDGGLRTRLQSPAGQPAVIAGPAGRSSPDSA